MAQNIQTLVPVTSVTYTDVQRIDLLSFQNLPAWVANGAQFLGRPSSCSVPGPTGYKAQYANVLPGLSTVMRMPDTAVGTLTKLAANPAILGGRPCVLASDNTDVKVQLNSNIFPASGPFWLYAVVNAIDNLFMIGGNVSSNSLLRLNFTNNDIRFILNNTVTLSATVSGGPLNKDIVVGFGRTAAGYLRIRYKLRGLPWVEVTSGAIQAGAVTIDLAFMANIVSSGYSPNGYWGDLYFADNDITGGTQPQVEAYLVNEYGLQ